MDAIEKKFGRIIRYFREQRGLSQAIFAEKCGISEVHYGRIERGEHSISLRLCELIADAFSLRLADLFETLE